jgi:hypothetical protein
MAGTLWSQRLDLLAQKLKLGTNAQGWRSPFFCLFIISSNPTVLPVAYQRWTRPSTNSTVKYRLLVWHGVPVPDGYYNPVRRTCTYLCGRGSQRF